MATTINVSSRIGACQVHPQTGFRSLLGKLGTCGRSRSRLPMRFSAVVVDIDKVLFRCPPLISGLSSILIYLGRRTSRCSKKGTLSRRLPIASKSTKERKRSRKPPRYVLLTLRVITVPTRRCFVGVFREIDCGALSAFEVPFMCP